MEIFPSKTKTKIGGIYFLFDDDEELLYIGIAKNFYLRLQTHFFSKGVTDVSNNTSFFKKHMSSFSYLIIPDYTREKAKELETLLIREYKPIFNYDKNSEYFLKHEKYEKLCTKKDFQSEWWTPEQIKSLEDFRL